MLVIRQEEESFVLYENGSRVGVCKKVNYPKDKAYGYIWKLPDNTTGRQWVSAGRMCDGLELDAHKERSLSRSSARPNSSDLMERAASCLSDDELQTFVTLLNKIDKAEEIARAKAAYEAALATYEALTKAQQ